MLIVVEYELSKAKIFKSNSKRSLIYCARVFAARGDDLNDTNSNYRKL